MKRFTWPGPLPDLSRRPFLRVKVTTPQNQAVLHRTLAQAGYVPERTQVNDDHEVWEFRHPDGEPCPT